VTKRKKPGWTDMVAGLSDKERRYLEEAEQNKVTLAEFRTAYRAGAFRSVSLRPVGEDFSIVARPRGETGSRSDNSNFMVLIETRTRRLRLFREVGTALGVLHSAGVETVEVQLKGLRIKYRGPGHRRPDMSQRLTKAHEEARKKSEMGGSALGG
jgi:hypothetical protein